MNIVIPILCAAVIVLFFMVAYLFEKTKLQEKDIRGFNSDLIRFNSGLNNVRILLREQEKSHEKFQQNNRQHPCIKEIRTGILCAMRDIVSTADKQKKAIKPEELERFGLLMTSLERFDNITGQHTDRGE